MQIPLKNNKILIDKEDFLLIKDFRFNLSIDFIRNKPYVRLFKNGVRLCLNKIITGQTKYRVKHKNNNPFDFRRKNLVLITPEYSKSIHKEWVVKNKKHLTENTLKYYYKNKEKIRARSKKYEKTERAKELRKLSLLKPERKYKNGKKGARQRKILFDIKFEDWKSLIDKGCFYCKTALQSSIGLNLDRINNSKGYHLDNVLPCCGNCNLVRHNVFTVEETQAMINGLLEYRNNKCWKGKDDDLIVLPEGKR